MSIDSRLADENVARVADGLAREFAETVPRSHVEDIVRLARQDLDGQIPPSALDELLHRLAHYRLSRLNPAH
ncbi:MAG TPA: hypothetical protein VFG87_25615 [Amycolatopsis sp.]|nr:hypothetical protein [Amycolatopsis sp.]